MEGLQKLQPVLPLIRENGGVNCPVSDIFEPSRGKIGSATVVRARVNLRLRLLNVPLATVNKPGIHSIYFAGSLGMH